MRGHPVPGTDPGQGPGEGPGRLSADIVVCVHNSPEDVRRCLAAAVRTLAPGDRLIVIDDGSADETRGICAAAAAAAPDRVVLVRHDCGSGFTRAANAGLRLCRAGMVVLLNSDTVVLPGWLDRLAAAFARHPRIGIVGPLSNAGGWQSIPGFGDDGSPPMSRVPSDDATLAEIQACCEALARRHAPPLLEQVNGFCLAIRAEVLRDVGLLDEVNFPRGYGEEVDFNFRAQDAGYLCTVALDCFVYHDKTKSYTPAARAKLIAEGRAAVDRLHGARRVRAAVENSRSHPVLAAIREETQTLFAARGWILGQDSDTP
ncbi:glycosyltransferase family 2 protein [Frigidibacter sp. MR17.24]|uniref:glycosyltransferase family 2 protein n=1 Tax=Frigidibacter sp. MR17.24 TaxID=3127345 RepID=UPI003012E30D